MAGGGDRAVQADLTADANWLAHALGPTLTAGPDCHDESPQGRAGVYSSMLLPPAAAIFLS